MQRLSPPIPRIRPEVKSPYPYIRTERPRTPKLTTIVGVQGKDGIILCADAQETAGEVRETVSKIDKIGADCLFAGATNDVSYMLEFENFLRSWVNPEEESVSGGMEFHRLVNGAISEYTKYIDSLYLNSSDRLYKEIMSRSEVQGVLARRFKKQDGYGFELYQIDTHGLAQAVLQPSHRAVAGSGGLFARLLFQGGENILSKIGFSWNSFSTQFLAQFLYLMVSRVTEFDSYSKGLSIWKLSSDHQGYLLDNEIFPNREKRRFRLSYLLESAIKEIGRKRLLDLFVKYDFLTVLDVRDMEEIRPVIDGVGLILEEMQKEIEETQKRTRDFADTEKTDHP